MTEKPKILSALLLFGPYILFGLSAVAEMWWNQYKRSGRRP